MDFKPLYEDNHIIVAVKPRNIPSQKDSSGDNDMHSIVKDYIRRSASKTGNVYLGLVHRLDRPVGGVMVFAKTSKAAKRITEQIKSGGMRRGYLAVVHGGPKPSATLTDYLLKGGDNMVKVVGGGTDGAKYARLSYSLLAEAHGLSLLSVHIETGRSHQIRVQLSHAGFPIYGDMRYGRGEKGAIALWSYELLLSHPTKKEEMRFLAKPSGPGFSGFLDYINAMA